MKVIRRCRQTKPARAWLPTPQAELRVTVVGDTVVIPTVLGTDTAPVVPASAVGFRAETFTQDEATDGVRL